jgi:hypothetical protein
MTRKHNKKQGLKKSGSCRIRSTVFPIGETQDLFDQVRVLQQDLEIWALRVAGVEPSSWRFTWYVENWNVAEKVKRAKLAGTWPPSLRP